MELISQWQRTQAARVARDHQLVRDMRADNDYRLAEVVPYRTAYAPGAYQIWVRALSRTGDVNPGLSGRSS